MRQKYSNTQTKQAKQTEVERSAKTKSVHSRLRLNNIVALAFVALVGATGNFALYKMDLVANDLLVTEALVSKVYDAGMKHDAARSELMTGLVQHFLSNSKPLHITFDTINEKLNQMDDAIVSLEKFNLDNTQLALISDIRKDFNQYRLMAEDILGTAFGDDFDPAMIEPLVAQHEQMSKQLRLFVENAQTKTHSAKKQADDYFHISLALATFFALLALTVLMALRKTTYNEVNKPLTALVAAMTKIERNSDLTIRVKVESTNELGHAAEVFNRLVESLQGITRDVQIASRQLKSSSLALSESSSAAVKVSQASNLEANQMAESADILYTSIGEITNQADDANNVSVASMLLSRESYTAIEAAHVEMKYLSGAVSETASDIELLDQSAKSISQVSEVIHTIAQKTDLLALNAAIEAALAGEQGRGFAVVADEVRNLAEQTSRSTANICSTVETIQSGTKVAVTKMTEGVTRASQSEALSAKVRDSVLQVETNAKTAAEAVYQISQRLHQQKQTGKRISTSAEKVAVSSQQAYDIAQQTALLAEELSGLSDQMQVRTNRFKV